MNKSEIKTQIEQIEQQMTSADFWSDKSNAQETIKRHQELKDQLEGVGKFDKGNAVLTIYAGAGGDDSEDFVRMLLHMYDKYIEDKGWQRILQHEHPTSVGGYRNITLEIVGNNAYRNLKHESGVHRLVRQSPFNAQAKRQTSFAMVEVTPVIANAGDLVIDDADLEITFAKSSGPGGQNVNKRETAVRIKHIPTGLSVHTESERTQERNRDKAMELLRGKLALLEEQKQKKQETGQKISKIVDNEWGNQIRSYVLHPYKMVKDHRSDLEIRDTDSVLSRGRIQDFIDAMQDAQG